MRRIIVLPDSGSCRYNTKQIVVFATDVGWAPLGGVKDNKEENDALAWKGVAIATLSAERGLRQSDQQRTGHSYYI